MEDIEPGPGDDSVVDGHSPYRRTVGGSAWQFPKFTNSVSVFFFFFFEAQNAL